MTVTVIGDVGAGDVDAVRRCTMGPFADDAVRNIVIDCAELGDVDLAAVDLIADLYQACRIRQGTLTLLFPTDQVQACLRNRQLDTVIVVGPPSYRTALEDPS